MQIEVPASRCGRLITTRPVIVITTLHESGVVNGGTFGAYTNVGPTEIGIAVGKPSHTYQNLKRTGEFVINVITQPIARASEVCGEGHPETESEIAASGLTTADSSRVAPPRIAECAAAIECRYLKELDIGYHSFVVGEAQGGWCEEGLLDDEGYFDVIKAQVVHCVRYPEPVYAKLGEYFRVDCGLD